MRSLTLPKHLALLTAALLASGAVVTMVPPADGIAQCRSAVGFFGHVTDTRGLPQSDTPVDLFVEPDTSEQAVGQSTVLPRIGHGITDEFGCYHVALADASQWLPLADAAGHLNLRLVVYRPGVLQQRLVSASLTTVSEDGGRALEISDSPGVTAAHLATVNPRLPVSGLIEQSFGVGNPAMHTATEHSTADGATTHVRVGTSDLSLTPVPPGSSGGIKWVLDKDFGDRSTVVGQFWSTTPAVSEKWVYRESATSLLGAAWSTTGANGSFSRSRTWSTEKDGSVGFDWDHGSLGDYYRTTFDYGRYSEYEYDYDTSRWYFVGTMIRRTAWDHGATRTTHVPVPSTQGCERYGPHTSDETSVSSARTWSDGVSLSAAMVRMLADVTLSSETGFTKTATNRVEFRKAGRLCGVDGPLSHPGAVVARRPA